MKNIKLNFLLVLYLICHFIWGCNSYKLAENIDSEVDFSYKIDTVLIPIDSSSLHYYNFYSTFIEGRCSHLAGYNKHNHTIDVFDLEKNNFSYAIQLDNQGPNAIGEIEGLFWHTRDSIFVYSANTLSIINDSGNLIERIVLAGANPEVTYLNNLYFRTFYNKEKNAVYFFNLTPADKKTKYLNAPLVSKLNLSSHKLEDLPITYSDYYKENNGELGFLSWLNLWETMDGRIVYNFQFESNIYTYDFDSKEVRVYGARTKKFNNLSSLIKTNAEGDLWVRHALENTHLFPVIYDKYRNLFYRFNWGNISYLKEDGLYNSFIDKPLSLTVLDADFNLLMEVPFPENTININTWFVSKDGLYISPTHPRKKDVKLDYLEFYVIKADVNEI